MNHAPLTKSKKQNHPKQKSYLSVNPARSKGHIGIDSREASLSTSNTKGDNPCLVPGSLLFLTNQRTAPVTLARVHAQLAASTDEALVQLVIFSKTGFGSNKLIDEWRKY